VCPTRPVRYLPLTMESEFQSHLGDVLPLILDGLSDEVREMGRRTDNSSSNGRPSLAVQCSSAVCHTCCHCQLHQQPMLSGGHLLLLYCSVTTPMLGVLPVTWRCTDDLPCAASAGQPTFFVSG
jgi:hypothetical protein